jgi:hypothetical protein
MASTLRRRRKATTIPAAPPKAARSRLSVSNWRTMRAGEAPSHFTLADRSTGEQQICDVGAGDEQHKANAAHKHKQRRPYIACDGIVESLQEDTKTNIATRIFPVPASRHGIEFATRLLQTYSIRQTDKGAQPVEIRGRTDSAVAPQLQ